MVVAMMNMIVIAVVRDKGVASHMVIWSVLMHVLIFAKKTIAGNCRYKYLLPFLFSKKKQNWHILNVFNSFYRSKITKVFLFEN